MPTGRSISSTSFARWIPGYRAHTISKSSHPRVWPYGVPDDQVSFSYDISVADCAYVVGLVYDWLYPALAKPQRDRIRGALLEKAITRVRGNYEYQWWATAYKCNWSGICHSGVGMAALALLTEEPRLIDVLARSCEGGRRDVCASGCRQRLGRGPWVCRVRIGAVDLFHGCD